VTAIVRGGRREDRRSGVVTVLIQPCCAAHAAQDAAPAAAGAAAASPPPCCAVLGTLRESCGAEASSGWWVTPSDTIVTSVRECDTLARLGNLRLLQPILRPDIWLAVAAEQVARVWPSELSDAVADGGFNAYLRSRWVWACVVGWWWC